MLISKIIFIMFSEHNDVYFSSSSWGKMSGKCWALPLHLAKPELPGSVVPGSLAASFVLASEQTEGRTDWDRLAELDWTGLDWTGQALTVARADWLQAWLQAGGATMNHRPTYWTYWLWLACILNIYTHFTRDCCINQIEYNISKYSLYYTDL